MSDLGFKSFESCYTQNQTFFDRLQVVIECPQRNTVKKSKRLLNLSRISQRRKNVMKIQIYSSRVGRWIR